MLRGRLLALLCLGAATLGAAVAADLNPATAKAWTDYVGSARAQMKARLAPTACFLWSQESADRLQRLRAGEILTTPADEQTPRRVPGGLIHHWLGAVFIPDATLAQVLVTLRDYSRYPEYYPSVVSSKLAAREGTQDRFTSVERHQAMFSKIALDADFFSVYTDAGDKRAYSESSTTRLQQIENFGGRGQVKMEPGAPSAYLWALSSISRYEERDGGVYLELDAMALSRDIPAALRWLVDPFVRQAAVNTLIAYLKQTRDAVKADRSKSFSGAISFRGQ